MLFFIVCLFLLLLFFWAVLGFLCFCLFCGRFFVCLFLLLLFFLGGFLFVCLFVCFFRLSLISPVRMYFTQKLEDASF